ncbi:RNA-directed DNA polymerase, eukaryota, reverse transcriptase zinc-binding domain protein [Tanacetum coccineum]
MIFKVDFEKAFDSVRWDFLDDVLKKFGFGDRWCSWIQSCLRSSRGSILVNGIPTKEFQFYKGLKQVDPLSPILFILIMESLHLSFQNTINECFTKWFYLLRLSAAHRIGCLQLDLFVFPDLGTKIGGVDVSHYS